MFSDPLFNKYFYLGEIEEGPREWNQSIIKGNRVFTSSKEWTNELAKGPKGYHHLLQPAHGISVLTSIKKWLEHVAAHEKGDTMVINTTYKIHTLLEQLERTLGSTEVDTLSVLKLVKQQLRSGTIDFVGEPLEGLQIMGILESRTLDFSHVIMAGVNEGILPAGRSFNSLLPYDIKQTYDLPTYEQKDAIFAYHFYRILQRCSEGVIVYNTNTDAMGGGEPSRYIVQLEQELQQGACTIHPRAFNNGPIHPSSIEDRFYAERSDAVKEAMADWMKRGMSATSLNELAGRPHDFYQKRLVRVREQDEVEESMSALVMGNLIHHGLEELYKPLVGKPLPVFDVDEWTQKALELGIERLVKEGYSESALYQGRNLVTLEVCKKMLDQFLHYDLLRAKAGKTILKGVETELEFEMQHPSLNLPLKFVGKVDRIEMNDGRLTVWDYKTGRMKPSELSLSTWEDLWNGKKPKALQCLLYAWLLWKSGAATSPLPWRIGMYKMQSPQPESLLRGGAFDGQVLGEQDLIEFEHQLMEFLVGQLSSDEPFVEPPPKDFTHEQGITSLTAVPSAADIQAAAERIAPYVSRTPVLKAPRFNHLANGDFYLKCEHLQMTGAFKARGAMNTVLVHKEEALKNGVLTHSSGNHGAALSWAAAQIGAKAYVVMPSNAPKAKIASVEYYGGIVTFCEPTLEARETTAEQVRKETGALLIHPYDNYNIIAGQATATYELLQEHPDLDQIFVPVGGGGLLAGAALANSYFGKAKVIGCEPTIADDAYKSFTSGIWTPAKSTDTIADGLKTSLGHKNFPDYSRACRPHHITHRR